MNQSKHYIQHGREMRESKKDWTEHERKTRITAETGNGKESGTRILLRRWRF